MKHRVYNRTLGETVTIHPSLEEAIASFLAGGGYNEIVQVESDGGGTQLNMFQPLQTP
jgi:hypothetical protein